MQDGFPEQHAPRRNLAVVHNPVFGGGANQLIVLGLPLLERGWETLAVLPDLPEARPTLERMRDGGLSAGVLELHRLRRTVDPGQHIALLTAFRREVARMRRLIRSERVALVQAFGDTNPHVAIAGHLEGAAVVWNLYDTVTPPAARRLTMPLVTRIADVILTTGQALARAHPGAQSLGERCIAVYPPVDTRRFVPSHELRRGARAELGVPENALLVGTVGNRNPSKGHEWLTRAAAGLRERGYDPFVRVLGAPSPVHEGHMSAVDREIDRRGLRDRMAFVDPGRRVAELMPALDVFVVSSVPRSEGMPTVILEAMSCGLPVVATDVGAIRECVEDGVTGFVVPPLDAEALATALARLAGNAKLRQRLGATGRERTLARHGLASCADAYVGAFELALTHRAGR